MISFDHGCIIANIKYLERYLSSSSLDINFLEQISPYDSNLFMMNRLIEGLVYENIKRIYLLSGCNNEPSLFSKENLVFFKEVLMINYKLISSLEQVNDSYERENNIKNEKKELYSFLEALIFSINKNKENLP